MNINTPFRNARNTENSMFSATNFCISSDKMAVGPEKKNTNNSNQNMRNGWRGGKIDTVPIVISLQLPKNK